MTMYSVAYSKMADKALKKLDKQTTSMIYAWIDKHLDGCSDPRIHGKALVGNKKGYWRYRVGAYRIIAEINDTEIIIAIVNISHRRDVYNI